MKLARLIVENQVPVAQAAARFQVAWPTAKRWADRYYRATGEPVRRYEHPHPGDMLHVDVKKLGNIPDGGGWRFVGRAQGERHRAATAGKPRSRHHNPQMGTAFVHTVLDDHSRVAYAEIHDDETTATATAALRRAVARLGTHPSPG